MKRALLLLAICACTNPTPLAPVKPTTVTASGPTLTRVNPDAQPVLDAWADAMGGREAIAALGAIHAKGSYEKGGMIGTIEVWITPRGERREEITLGVLREVRVFDGTRGWLVDRNREVRELAGFELDDQRSLAFREAFAPLLTDRRPGTVLRDGDALTFAPEGGNRPEKISFDRGTKLIDSATRRDGEKSRTTRFSDWNLVDGVKLPFTVREETGNSNETVVIHWKRIERGHTTVGTFTRPPDRDADFTLAANPTEVPIEVVYGGLIFVKVEVNGQPMSFILDTGAEFTLLNSSRVSKLNLQAIGTFATGAGGGDVVVSFVPKMSIQVGGATTTDQIIAAVLLDELEKPLQRPLDGILGYDFLSRFVVELDYKNQRIRLHDRAKYHHTGAGKAIPITLEDSTPYLDASIEVPKQPDVRGHFVVDTGCLCDVTFFTPFVDQHQLLTAFPHAKQAGYSAGAGGTTNQMTATIPTLKIGDQVIKDVKADFARDKHGATADPEVAGLIGSLTWKRYLLVLDYKAQRIFLDPTR